MEEGVRDIQLPCVPLATCGDGQHRPNRGRLDDRRKGFAKVNSGTLREPPYHPASFITIEGSVGVEFVFEDPLPEMI